MKHIHILGNTFIFDKRSIHSIFSDKILISVHGIDCRCDNCRCIYAVNAVKRKYDLILIDIVKDNKIYSGTLPSSSLFSQEIQDYAYGQINMIEILLPNITLKG